MDEIDLAGTPAELQLVRTSIEHFARGDGSVLVIAANFEADPAPYEFLLRELRIVRGGGPTRLSLEGEEALVVSGSRENLVGFSSWFNFAPDAEPGEHNHHDYLPDSPHVAPDSRSLVVSVSSEAQGPAGDAGNPRA